MSITWQTGEGEEGVILKQKGREEEQKKYLNNQAGGARIAKESWGTVKGRDEDYAKVTSCGDQEKVDKWE